MLSSLASSLSSASSSSYKIDNAYNYGEITIPNYLQFWQVYKGVSKKTGFNVSIFKFDKKNFELYIKNKQMIKETYSQIVLEIVNLQKIKHPNFLNVVEPLEIHTKCFIFVTEPIASNLRLKYGNDTMYTINNQKDKAKDSLVFKKGIYELSKALDFVHNKLNKVILNVSPDSIFIDSKGNWKIGSLVNMLPKTDAYYDVGYSQEYKYGSNINYSAPELIYDGKFNYTSDYFSLGLLVYFLIYGSDLIKTDHQSLDTYKMEYKKLETNILKVGYKNLFPLLVVNNSDYFFIRLLTNLLNRDREMRCSSLIDWIHDEFNNENGSKDNELIKTLLFIEKGEFHSVNSKSQIIFLNGLNNIWREFNHHILINQIIVLLLEVTTLKLSVKQQDETDLDILKLALNLVLDITDAVLTKQEFTDCIYGELAFNKLVQINPIFEIFLKRISTFQEKLDSMQFVTILNDVFLKKIAAKDTLQAADHIALHQIVLSKDFVLVIMKCVQFELTKSYTNPILLTIFSTTQSLKVKLSCLDIIETLVSIGKINRYQMNDNILKMLESNKTNNEKITLSILKLLTKLVQSNDFYNEDKVVLLDRILPLLWKLSMTQGISLSSFNKFQNIINFTTRRIQELQIELIKAQGGSQSEVSEDNGSEKDVQNSFKHIVQQVDISKGTNAFTDLEQKQLDKLNNNVKIMMPKKDVSSASPSNNATFANSRNTSHANSFQSSMSPILLTPKIKHPSINSAASMPVLNPKIKR